MTCSVNKLKVKKNLVENEEKTYDKLNEWKEKYNAKENERLCQYRNYQVVQTTNKEEIKQLKEKNASLRSKLAVKSYFNKTQLKRTLSTKSALKKNIYRGTASTTIVSFSTSTNKSDENAKEILTNDDNTCPLNHIGIKKGNDLLSNKFLNEVRNLNLLLYERKELQQTLIDLQERKLYLENHIKLVSEDKSADTIANQIKYNQNLSEKIRIKYETANYINNVLNRIKSEFLSNVSEENKLIETFRNELCDKIEMINKLKIELKDNNEKRKTMKIQVEALEKEILERKQKREEYLTIIQQAVEEAKMSQARIKSEKDEKHLKHATSSSNVSKSDESENFKHEAAKLKKFAFLYNTFLNLKMLTTSIEPNKIYKFDEKKQLLTNNINELTDKKYELENKLEDIRNEYHKRLCLSENQNDKGVEMSKEFNEKTEQFELFSNDLMTLKNSKGCYLNAILASIAGLCSKTLIFKSVYDIIAKSTVKINDNKNQLTLSPNNIPKLYSETSQFSSMSKAYADNQIIFSHIPTALNDQFQVIIDAANLLNEFILKEPIVDTHYYIQDPLMNKLINFNQNAYANFTQDEEVKSTHDDYEQDFYSFDAFNDYLPREKIKMRSQDKLSRKSKLKDLPKMLARIDTTILDIMPDRNTVKKKHSKKLKINSKIHELRDISKTKIKKNVVKT